MNIYSHAVIFASQFSILFPIAIYITRVNKVRKQIHSIGILVIVSGVCDLMGYTLVREGMSTAIVLNAFFLFQFFFLSHYYYQTVFSSKPHIVLGITMLQYALALIVVTLFYDEFHTQHLSVMWAISSVILIAYSILYFKKMIKHHQTPRIYRYGNFWINSAVFLYFSLSIWLFAIRSDARIAQWSDDTYQTLWSFYRINNVLKNVMFVLGIYYSIKSSVKADHGIKEGLMSNA